MVSKFPEYGVLWTGRVGTAPVVFYRIRNASSYYTLARYLQRHPEWDSSFHWKARRWTGYQRELEAKGAAWVLYQETAQGWRVSAASAPWDGSRSQLPQALAETTSLQVS